MKSHKIKSKLACFLITAFVWSSSAGAGPFLNIGNRAVPENLVEKSKALTYSYKLNVNDPIAIENHFGDVKIKLWDKEEIRVDITVTANAPTNDKAEAFLKMIDIKSEKKLEKVIFNTRLNCLGSAYANNISKSGEEDDRNFLRVDYKVYMPAGHDLTLINSHGDVYIPPFNDRLEIHQKYGVLYADHLKNPDLDIDVNFGKAFIKSMTGGRLSATQTILLVDRVDDVVMENTCGRVQVLEANNLDMKAAYTRGFVKKVKDDCHFQVKYSREFKLGEIDGQVEQVKIDCSHTNLELPLCLKGSFEVMADTQNTEIEVADEPGVKYLNTSSPGSQHILIGQGGVKPATKVLLTTQYGKVEVK